MSRTRPPEIYLLARQELREKPLMVEPDDEEPLDTQPTNRSRPSVAPKFAVTRAGRLLGYIVWRKDKPENKWCEAGKSGRCFETRMEAAKAASKSGAGRKPGEGQ